MNDRDELAKGALTDKEKRLLSFLREINYGEIKIFIQDKQPVRIEEIKKSIKL
ncbi:MAG: YezD family protein [Tepidanaerobacteraceae bacterium]|jgi:hypothetical protein|nr:YezD family protein [Tepidanaerobacteraceae bacterium]